MRQATDSFQPIMWWIITEKGNTLHKSHYNPEKDGEIKYLILHARERYQDKRTYNFYWLEKHIVHNSNNVECDFEENGVTGTISHYDKTFGGCITCSITDQHGKNKLVRFYGNNLAFTKCIRYMQGVSKAPSWDAYELQLKNQEIQKLKREVQELKAEKKRLKAEQVSGN